MIRRDVGHLGRAIVVVGTAGQQPLQRVGRVLGRSQYGSTLA